MEQCYFSFMLFGRYFQLTKASVFQILAEKDGWKIVFKIDFNKKKSKYEEVNNSGNFNNLKKPSEYAEKRIEFKNKFNSLVNAIVNEVGIPLPKYDYEIKKFTTETSVNIPSKNGGVIGSTEIMEFDSFYEAVEHIISWKARQ